ncbi:nuclear pore complex protein NUP62 isoform X1 [Cucumis melo var. makuwa]|uniref:Nuclear pore complex protein NUP62 isoform X1 n=1 Tax=Cucumis melo var. makuwa TaxID=1194695 RepID=A0A5A7TL81_CUCMM|nr:nuclear pore complex protein NUP62 isoform X1 [Cucumis melo var. makuwa]
MDAVGTDTDRRFCRLSLIDFASEDDFLLPSPSCDLHDVNSLDITNEDDEHDKIRQSEAIDCSRIQERTDAFEQREDKAQLLPSSEPEGIRRNGKYNLRKSLAWDSAFFTSAGFLDPEELTSMIAPVGRNEKRVLPIISEDVQKSSDSISTLESEIMPLESIEGNLFEDVRASIQKSSRIVGKANSRTKVESGRQEARKPPSAGRLDLTSQNKMKDSSASSKLPDALQGPGRTIKQNSSQPRGGQQLKAVGRLPSSSLSSKRPSLGHNPTATAKDGTISGTRPADRRDSVSLRTTAHRPTRISTSAKSGQKTSSDVSTSSSDKVGKSSSKDVRKKTECKALPSSGVQNTPSRVASKVTSPFGKSRLSSKFASGISPASSISEWSTESSSNSTLELRSNSPRVSLRSLSSKRISTDSEASHDGRNHPVGPHTQTTGLLSQSVKKASSQSSILPPASTKPSGLRLPSPKIGYFDGSKTSSPKSNLAVPGGTTKIGAGNVSTNGGESKIKPSKLQPARLLPKSATRANIHPTMNLKSHKSSATKMSKTNALDQKVKELHREGSNTDLHGSDACAESKDISGATREELTKENESFSNANETVATNSQGEPNNTSPDF